MTHHVATGFATAAHTLTSTAILADLTADVWDTDLDVLVTGGHLPVWEGPASLGPPSDSRATDANGAEVVILTRRLRLPPDAPVAVGQRVYVDPPRDIEGAPELDGTTCYVVWRVLGRTTSVLRRALVVSLSDVQAVPR